MNLLFRPPATKTTATHALMEQALAPDILTGMPQLTAQGLSKTWLLKELGHRHWLMLARVRGMDDADFRDVDGAEIYAAICALSMIGLGLSKVRANQVLTIGSSIHRLSRTQVMSIHNLGIDGEPLGRVEMISTFVRRMREDDNHSIVRVELPGLGPIDAGLTKTRLPERAVKARGNGLVESYGLVPRPASDERLIVTFDPVPSEDFNGAGLLYFSSFAAFVDRAAWAFDRRQDASGTLCEDLFFFGNINPGDRITVERLASGTGEVAGRIIIGSPAPATAPSSPTFSRGNGSGEKQNARGYLSGIPASMAISAAVSAAGRPGSPDRRPGAGSGRSQACRPRSSGRRMLPDRDRHAPLPVKPRRPCRSR